MQSHQPAQSHLTQFINRHPGYSVLGMMATLVAPAFDLDYWPLLFVGLRLGAGFYNEIKRRTDSPHKVESQFQDARFKLLDVVLGELVHHENQLPVVKVYTDHPHLSAMAEAGLMSRYYPDFHANYFRYLFLLARFVKGPRNKSAVEFINQEARRRGIKLDDVSTRLYYFIKELYGYIEEYNKTAPFYLRISNEFDLEYFRAIILFCEIEKGLGRANGCSTSVIDQSGKKEMIRLLDWFTFGTFQEWQINILKIISGRAVFLSGIVPGFVTITACNEEGLQVAYNEAGGKTGNRENPEGGYPGLLLTHNIAAECETFAEAENYLETHPPASAHILTIVAEDNHGIIQCMPNQSGAFFNVLDKGASFCVATNHFLDEKREPIPESACIAGPVVGSLERRERIESATFRYVNSEEKVSLKQTGMASESKDTVQAILSELNYKKPEHVLHINVANGHAVSAIDRSTSEVHYNTVNLTQLSSEMHREVKETSAQLTPEKIALIGSALAVDEALIQLMNKLSELDQSHPALAKELSDFCSSLVLQCELSEKFPEKALLSRKDIQLIADQTTSLISTLLANDASKNDKFSRYEELIRQKITKERYSSTYDNARLMDGLVMSVMAALLAHFTTTLIQQNASPKLLEWASGFFAADMSLFFNAQRMTTTIVAALSASHFLFKRPAIEAQSDAVVNSFRQALKPG